MDCRLFRLLRLNRLQRKVVLVVLVIILVPMLISGLLSASWIAGRMDDSIERWVRESAKVSTDWLDRVNGNGQLFADLLDHTLGGRPRFVPGESPIPPPLQPLALEMGINLIQVFDEEGRRIFSSPEVTLDTAWVQGQNHAMLKASLGQQGMLAAITIARYPADQPRHYRLVLGTLFDKQQLSRLSETTGMKARLFYPRDGDFAKAFSEEDKPLRLRLPPDALFDLRRGHDYYSDGAENGTYWGLYTPVADATGRVEAVLFNGLERGGSQEFLTDKLAITLAITLLGTVLAGFTGLLLSRLVVRPVTYLREGVMKVAAQDFRTSVPITWHDEIGDLTRAFNGMAARLREARDEQQRDFQREKITALGELSLAMAHEIRNPIGVINTAAKMLERAEDPQKRDNLQRMIREECQRLDQFLKDFQQLARHRKPQLTRFDPAAPLDKALLVTLAGREEIEVTRDYRHHGVRICADAELLHQAWVNLIRNALEAMEGHGRLAVGSKVEAGQVVLHLHDSGPGIPLELISRLFEPFFTTKSGGSGLGLTLASTLVQASGAALELVPQEEGGARFAMRFNICEEEP
ncbi:sensor histidine kinase [Endothiovibrio diazotrophicus]